MRKLVFTLAAATAILFAGAEAWNANAASLSGAAAVSAAAHSQTQVEVASCRGTWGRCPPGRVWGCGPRGCWCRPC
jgi:hypothetical protein